MEKHTLVMVIKLPVLKLVYQLSTIPIKISTQQWWRIGWWSCHKQGEFWGPHLPWDAHGVLADPLVLWLGTTLPSDLFGWRLQEQPWLWVQVPFNLPPKSPSHPHGIPNGLKPEHHHLHLTQTELLHSGAPELRADTEGERLKSGGQAAPLECAKDKQGAEMNQGEADEGERDKQAPSCGRWAGWKEHQTRGWLGWGWDVILFSLTSLSRQVSSTRPCGGGRWRGREEGADVAVEGGVGREGPGFQGKRQSQPVAMLERGFPHH